MTRRRFIALVGLVVLVALGAIAVGSAVFATQSNFGQMALRKALEARVAASINGHVHIGRISGNFLTGATIDSLELRDDNDSLFVATGKITLEYDPRDLVDRRLFFSKVTLEHPAIVLRQHENWQWNYRRLFRIKPQTNQKKGPERGFMDFVIMDSVRIVHGGNFRLTIPWHPDDSLHGVRRDSAIKANVARKDHEIRLTSEGVTQTYRFTSMYAVLSHIRIADPDSAGQKFVVDTLHADVSTPPFNFKNIVGVARVLGDSAWFETSHWDLPGSTGKASGKVWWGSDLPVRYAVHVIGDSVSLKDVAWVYPTLPTTGGGSMVLDIRNEKDLTRLDYALTDMDVHSTKSRLRGAMTFDVGGPVLAVHDVKLTADPANFDLLRTLNGKPFPADWQGNLVGTVTARGGPLTHFYVDESDLVFHDAHVPDAVSHIKGHGELDILFPAFTAFHHFSASTDHFDLRTLVAIYPAFPRVTGIMSGSAVLDSSWLDVRVSDANLTHTDGPAAPSHATGAGRITYGDKFMTYDMSLQMAPLSFSTLALSYPKMVLRGTLNGPMHVKGIAPSLEVQTDLAGAAGHITFVGLVDADSIGGYGAKGSGTFDSFDAMRMVDLTTPRMRLAGTYDIDVNGDSVANLVGPLDVRLGQSDIDSLRFARGTAHVRFDLGVMYIDSLQMTGAPGVMSATGALGMTRSAGADSLVVNANLDSIGGLRPYLAVAKNPRVKRVANDSLSGGLTVRGVIRGWLDSLDVHAAATGDRIYVRGDAARSMTGALSLIDVRGRITGALQVRADSGLAAGMPITTANIEASILDVDHARFAGGALAESGASMRTAGTWSATKDTNTIVIDTLNLTIAKSHWSLGRASRLTQSPAGVALDTLFFTNGADARISGFLDAPSAAAVHGRFHADSIPLGDVGFLAQLQSPLAGRLSADLNVSGTRDEPTMNLFALARGLSFSSLTAESVNIQGGYGADRASILANVLRGGRSVLDATVSYPIALTLFSAAATDDSVRGRIHADSIELALIEALSPKIKNATGKVGLDLALSGRPDTLHVGGRVLVKNGGLEVPDVGLKIAALDGTVSIDAAHDSLTINRLAWTSPSSGGTATLLGSVVFRDVKEPKLDLRLDATGFRGVDKKGLARLDVSTGTGGLTLAGTPDAARLSGSLNVDRGTIYIPELVRKQLVDLTPEDFAQLFDTTDVKNRSIMPQPPAALVEHLQLDSVSVHLGEDVWLRSREANIKLGGTLNVTRTFDDRERGATLTSASGDSARYKLALSGTLSADRGTYTLDLTAVQREFQVQSGRITFFGTPDFNPEIDVSALYQLKQSSRADIGIKARIHGNFYPQPALELSSSDAYLSPSDLVSYLVTGRPSLDLGDQTQNSQRALEFVLPTLSASVSRALRDQLGGYVDLFQIQSGAADQTTTATTKQQNQFQSFLSSTRVGGEKQIKDRLFLSVSTGLCFAGGEDQTQSGFGGFAKSIEGKLEYRLPVLAPDRLSLRAGLDPAASAFRCGNADVRGFVQTPLQVGFSLFRSWVF